MSFRPEYGRKLKNKQMKTSPFVHAAIDKGFQTCGRSFLLFSLLLLVVFSNAQTRQKEDTTYVNTLLSQSKALFGEDPAKAIAIAKQAYTVAQAIKFEKGEATALKNIGIGYYFQQQYVETLDYWNQSLKLFEQMNDKAGISNLLNNIGAVYMDKGDDARALDYCLRSLKIAEDIQDKSRIMSSLATVASIYHNKQDPRAINYLLKALPLAEETGDKEALPVLLGNIGEVYFDQGNDEEAMAYYQRAINNGKDIANAAFALNGMGKIALRKKEFDLALKHHAKALEIAEKVNDKMQQLRALKGMANVYLQKQNFPLALTYYEKAKALGEEINANVELQDIYQEMAAAYANISDYRNAFFYKTKYADIKDTLYNIETAKKLGNLQFDFDLYKKEGEIKLLTKEKQMSESKLKGLAAALLVLLFVAAVLWRINKTKQRAIRLLQRQKTMTDEALNKLKATQEQLIQSEKMASLGELTAGIAHEIQNPLNFITNFSELSSELLSEMEDVLQQDNKSAALSMAADVKQNLQKINHHGKRADAIVKGMLQHSSKRSGTKEPTDINLLVKEYLNLAYHGYRAKDDSFRVILESHFDQNAGNVNVLPQEIGRVLLNLYNNAFYAVAEKKRHENGNFEPVVSVSTKKVGNNILIHVSDNGTGIKQQLVKKVFQPFFTTKPSGEGTGLGLSLSYDIITKGHGGELKVESKEGEGTDFLLQLPVSKQ